MSNKKGFFRIVSLILALVILLSVGVTISASTTESAAGDLTVEEISFNNPDFIKGMDVSSVIALENSGVKYYDENGEEADLFQILSDNGVNYIRVRVWNDPYDREGNGYGGGNNDVNTAARIGARAARYNMKLFVDFHYSDFWADPSKQQAPKDWANYDVQEKAEKLSEFTAESLQTIRNAGADIGMVQIGNETTTGIAGVTEFDDMAYLLNAGSQAVKNFDSGILVAVHFTNPEKTDTIKWFADKLDEYSVNYDVFAVSYYPNWHGSLSNLTEVLDHAATTYNVYTMVAETAYAYTLEDSDGYGNTITPNTVNDENMIWDFSVQGQADEVRDVMAAVNNVSNGKGLGVFYWEGAWITVGDTTNLEGEDYTERVNQNMELWQKYGSGWASSYAADYDYDAAQNYGGSCVDNQAFFDPSGKVLPSLKVFKLVGGDTKPTDSTEETETASDTEITEDSSASEFTEPSSDTEVTEPSSETEATETSGETEATETEVTETVSDTEATEPTSESRATQPTTESEITEPTTESIVTQPTTESVVTPPTGPFNPTLKTSSVSLKAGQTAQIVVLNSNGASISYRCKNTNAAVVDENGLVSALKKGSTEIVVYVGNKKLTYKVTITTNPSIKVNNKEFKKSQVYTVMKNKYINVTVSGKAKAVNNIYSSSNKKVAAVTSAATATTVKIKGIKKGTATVTVKVNGFAFDIKVKVNEYKSYVINGMEVGSVQSDGSILFKMQKNATWNGRAMFYLLSGNTKRKIVLPKKTIKIDRVIHMGNNKTLIATGATIMQTDWKKTLVLNECKKTNYNSLKNVTIEGGTWKVKWNEKAKRSTSTFRFAHAQKITLKNCTIDTNYISHAVELIACKNVTITGCKLMAKGKQKNDKYAKPLQIDIATKATAPAIAAFGKKYVNGQICKNITVKNCTVKGSRGICTNKTDTENGKWLGKHHINVKIIGCTVTGMATEALCLHNVMGVTVKNNKVYSMGSNYSYNNGCYFYSGGYNASTSKYKNEFSGNIIKGGVHALRISTAAGNKHGKTTIKNNKLYAKSGASAALSVSDCTKVVKKGNKLYKW
ncbi:MAG: glycosyl hydrolase 53 family protein [Ruminococcus sp.]|nr:glycosyl hydrolase 53 family protein [Ruminococcus sp.]